MSQPNSNDISNFWNERFSSEHYIYGTEPNTWFRSVIDTLQPGTLFVPGAGEGRDAVYAATRGWQVTCADLSAAGKEKALKLAHEKAVSLDYHVMNIDDVSFQPGELDMIASIFFHLPPAQQATFFANVQRWLRPGGSFVLEAFTPLQLNYSSGGPKDINMLMTAERLKAALPEMHFYHLEETLTHLQEGSHHSGTASVVRCHCVQRQ